MNKTTRWVLILAIAAGVGAVIFFLPRNMAPEQQAVVHEQEPPVADNEALTRHPVPGPGTADTATGIEPEKPLPELKDSDAALQESLSRLFDAQRLGELFILEDMINRFVVTVDNLPRAKLPLQNLPTNPPPGKFLVHEKSAGAAEINPENYKRYARYVQFVEDLDTRKIASVYFHFYPLFQEAYRNLGYKSAYFNDRLVDAIDELLAAPEVKDPVQLVQPSVFYKYADPRLESLSAGQKLMIRIGPENAAKLKAKLRELRQALTARGANN